MRGWLTLPQVVLIDDPFGPAGYDGDLDAIVVSEETRKGGDMVNAKRAAKGLKILEVDIMKCIGADGEESEASSKLSSTQMRQWLAEKKFSPTGSLKDAGT